MGNPFLAGAAFLSPSLNRVRVLDFPGNQFPNHLRGLSGFDLLSSSSLRAMVNARAGELSLQADVPNLLRTFDACFNAPSMPVRSAAQQIAKAYGRRLGLLLLTLKRADPANRHAHPSWGLQQWRFWQKITTIHIGGGLLSGAMGPIAIASAQGSLRSCGFDKMNVKLSPLASYLPLAGLARAAPLNTRAMLLLDFGQTYIKRAVALYTSGNNSELRPLPRISARIEPEDSAGSNRELAQECADNIINVVAQSWQDALVKDWSLNPVIGLSLACYLLNGHPPTSEMGFYGCMQLLAENVQQYLADRISEAIGREVRIILMHDGSAAALAFAGSPKTVVVMLGTAIGVGFPPDTSQKLLTVSIESEDWQLALDSVPN